MDEREGGREICIEIEGEKETGREREGERGDEFGSNDDTENGRVEERHRQRERGEEREGKYYTCQGREAREMQKCLCQKMGEREREIWIEI
jgi:hypothetical protein